MVCINIDGHVLKRMIIEGTRELEKNKQLVDSLNVFPVPDGDTGTNMTLTALAAVKELEKINTASVSEVARMASSGSLRGARGNSGVILSQLFRGFAKGLDGRSTMTTTDLGQALLKASETAYRAVMKPKEGTILTVSKYIAEHAIDFSYDSDDLDEMFQFIIKVGQEILARTMQMLPQLKQAGVVDSGGYGLLCILEGMYRGLRGESELSDLPKLSSVIEDKADSRPVPPMSAAAMSMVDITFIYCTEFFIDISKFDINEEEAEEKLKQEFEKIGDSIVVVCDENLVKVHVHSNHPGEIIEIALKLGDLSNLKIDNMRIQHTNITGSESVAVGEADGFIQAEVNQTEALTAADEPIKPVGFVAVVPGEGFSELFRELSADEIIEGGQTMNPSTEDILQAAERVNAELVIVLPNNKNIILAAQQAEEISKNRKLLMIPTKTVPQGIAALINYVSSNSLEENVEGMKAAMAEVKTGAITIAVRATTLDGYEVAEGDVLCLLENDIAYVGKDVQAAALELTKLMVDENSTIITIYYGCDVNEEAAALLMELIKEAYPDCDVEIQYGAQPVYFYYISVE